MRVNPRQSQVKAVYKTHIDAIHFRKTDERRLHGLDEENEQKLFTEERVTTLKELANKPDIYERLSSALAPSIYEHEDIKKVALCFYLGVNSFEVTLYTLRQLCASVLSNKQRILESVYLKHTEDLKHRIQK